MEGGCGEEKKQQQPVAYRERRHGCWLMNSGEVSLFLAAARSPPFISREYSSFRHVDIQPLSTQSFSFIPRTESCNAEMI
jgi:hypothetical protein